MRSPLLVIPVTRLYFCTHIFTLEIFLRRSLFVVTSSHTLHYWKSSVFGVFLVRISRIQIEYGEIRSISPYSVRMLENADQKNSKYGHFSCNATHHYEWTNNKVSFSSSPQPFTQSIQSSRLISKSRHHLSIDLI